MKRFVSLSLVFTMVLLLLVISPLSVKASSDNTPPELRSFEFAAPSYTSGDNVVVTVTAYDVSGLSTTWSRVYLKSTDTSKTKPIDMGFGTDITSPEDKEACIYTLQYQLSVNDSLGTGTYYINQISLMDSSQNRIGYSTDLNQGPYKIDAKTIDVTNTIRSDFTGPVLEAVEVDKTSINVGETATISIRATDESGVRCGQICLRDPLGRQFYKAVSLNFNQTDPELLTGTFKAEANYEPGDYSISEILLFDYLDNYMYYLSYNDSEYITLPDEWKKSINVINPNYNAKPPTVEKVTFSKIDPNTGEIINITSAKPGDIVKITAEIKDNGTGISNTQLYFQPIASYALGSETDLQKDREGKYSCNWTVPANLQLCNFSLAFYISQNNSSIQQYFGSCNDYNFPTFGISTVFNGLDDKSIIKGSGEFDTLTGVTASNDSEGDMTSKIKISGRVDTSKAGLYLLRYTIISKQRNDMGNGYLNYYESRWIGVTDTMPDTSDPNAPLSLTSGSLQIGADSSDVSVQKDGKDIAYSVAYSTPGTYSVRETLGVYSMSANSGLTATGVIDLTPPALTADWDETGLPIKVTVIAKDSSGVASLKYMPGNQSLDNCKNNGTIFTDSFSATSGGKYTIYSRDKLGNECIKVFDIGQQHAVTYYTNGATAGSLPIDPNKYYVGDTIYVLGSGNLVKTGFIFSGWNTSANGSGTFYQPYGTFTMPGNALSLYAQWQPVSAYLQDLRLSPGASITPDFKKTKYNYKVLLDEYTSSVTITPVKESDNAAMTMNGLNGSSLTVDLNNGQTVTRKIRVTYGRTMKTYTFTITRAKSTNNELSGLNVSIGNDGLTYDATTQTYTLQLNKDTPSVRVTPVKSSSLAKVSPGAKTYKVKNGKSLKVKITVTAQSGARKTYWLIITRANI